MLETSFALIDAILGSSLFYSSRATFRIKTAWSICSLGARV
jgi:hypothetical protein